MYSVFRIQVDTVNVACLVDISLFVCVEQQRVPGVFIPTTDKCTLNES